jgi:adenylate kinase
MSELVPILVLIGAPGSGKGTQGDHIAEDFNLPKISTGVLLREEMAAKTKIGHEISQVMSSGGLVDDATVLAVLKSKMKDRKYLHGVILDGFPRSVVQAEGLDDLLAEFGKQFKLIAIHINVSDEDKIVERISNRYYCVQCGTNYNKLYKNPKVPGTCDVCGGHKFAVRDDDKPEIVRSRLRAYYEKTKPLLAYYNVRGVLLNVDGHASEDEIFQKISSLLQRELKQD